MANEWMRWEKAVAEGQAAAASLKARQLALLEAAKYCIGNYWSACHKHHSPNNKCFNCEQAKSAWENLDKAIKEITND